MLSVSKSNVEYHGPFFWSKHILVEKTQVRAPGSRLISFLAAERINLPSSLFTGINEDT